MSASFALFLAQAAAPTSTTTGAPAPTPAPDASSAGSGLSLFMFPVMIALLYFAFIRPQSQAKKKQEDLIKTAKTGDRVVTTSGIHGVITNVKDSTVMVKVADNVKVEIEKTHIDRVLRPESADADKVAVAKA